jgi:hypothetical protein
MKIPRENGAWPHFIIQTIIYAAKGGLDKSSPYNKSTPHKIWKNEDRKNERKNGEKWGLSPFSVPVF